MAKILNVSKILRKSNCWNDFKSYLQPLSNKEKGDSFEALTKCFLQLHPKYSTQLKNVWFLKEVPPRINKHLNLPDQDEGIDLIAETKDGKFWAIQCKYREDETKSLTRKDLSTFTDLTFNVCQNIEFGLICTTVDRFSHKLKLYDEKLSFCSGEVWRALGDDFFGRLHRFLAGKAVPLKPTKPRPHQKRAIKNAFQHFAKEKNPRGKLIMPCGTGKSLCGYWIAGKLDAKRILVALPSLALIRQTLEVWTKEAVANKQEVSWIAVCSDESVKDFNRDDVAVMLQDLGIRVHTDPKEIAEWLKTQKRKTTVVFTTYQSGKVTAEASRMARIRFDLGIMDEAHKTVGKAEGLFSHLLHDENIKIKNRIFMTATERRYRGSSDLILSMDDLDIYGDTFELLTFKEALEVNPPILSDYKIVTIVVSKSEIAELIAKNIFIKPDKGKWDEEVEAETMAAMVALRKAMGRFPIKKAVSFHSTISRANAFRANQDTLSKSFPSYGKLETFHVSGKTPTSVRSREIDEFANAKRSLITNARCLTEGVDVPNIDCVLFADPKRSTIDIVQAVGRALRTHKGKRYGYVIVPVLLDNDIVADRGLQKDAFDAILMTLRAMAADDERIVEYFRSISQGRRPGRNAPVDIDIPEGMVIDTEKFRASIQLQVWSRLAKLSWRPFEEARKFVHGLGLKNQKEWNKYYKGELPNKAIKPEDIPTSPQSTYKKQGWVSYGDWLGTGAIAAQNRKFRSFQQARSFVHGLDLKNVVEWNKYCQGKLTGKSRKPEDIPTHPHTFYKKQGWDNWGDWLGTGTIAHKFREFRSFQQARSFVHGLDLKNVEEWNKYCQGNLTGKSRKPEDIPNYPNEFYKKNQEGWVDWGDWLGTGFIAVSKRDYLPFKQAREFVLGLGLKAQGEWRKYCNGELLEKGYKPENIPSNPHLVYKKTQGWVGYGDWLGTGRRRGNMREFKKARKFVHNLGLKSSTEWKKYCQGKLPEKGIKPEDIPANPNATYKNQGWISFGDWLGTGFISYQFREYRPFKQAREFVHGLGLKGQNEWKKYCQGKLPKKISKPKDIPSHPEGTYKNQGWVGMKDWLGTAKIKKKRKS